MAKSWWAWEKKMKFYARVLIWPQAWELESLCPYTTQGFRLLTINEANDPMKGFDHPKTMFILFKKYTLGLHLRLHDSFSYLRTGN